ncbi:type II toxin-antitoxin system RelE/ParE family toxin [Sphingopyxis sp. NJF-3]
MDLARIEDFFAAIDPEFAIRASDATFAAADFLLEQPRAGPVLGHGSLRKWKVRETPILLIYQIESHGIAIVRVQHDRSDWQTLL